MKDVTVKDKEQLLRRWKEFASVVEASIHNEMIVGSETEYFDGSASIQHLSLINREGKRVVEIKVS